MMFLSIMGMYEHDQTVFDGLNVPDGINKNSVINEICMQCAELELVYPNFDTMKLAIGVWSDSNVYTWDKLYKTTQLSYNPIWNVDAHETEKFIQDKNNVLKYNSVDKTLYDSQQKTTYDTTEETTYNSTQETTYNSTQETTYDSSDTESVKGFNSTSWSDAKKNTRDGKDTIDHTGTDTIDHTGTDTIEHDGTDTIDRTGADTVSHSGSDSANESTNYDIVKDRSGNIGVTTTQKMITEEREIAAFNMINYIAMSFKERFCLLVY